MEYEEIIEAIGREAADLPPDVVGRAAQAVLQTLAERLPRGEARHIRQPRWTSAAISCQAIVSVGSIALLR